MTNFEAYDERNSKKKSFIIKLVIWKIFLNAFMPLISSFYFYSFGQFDEFTPEWYKSKGINIQITSYLRIFSLIGIGIVRYLKPRLIAWYDRKFTKDVGKTRKFIYVEYQRVYTFRQFDIETSYAEACTSIFVALSFGFMFPNIYFVCLLQLVILYYRDKLLGTYITNNYLVMNTYIFLSIFNKKNHAVMRNILILASFASSILCIWVFGNIDYFPDKLTLDQIDNSFDIIPTSDTNSDYFYFEKNSTNSISPSDFQNLISYTKYNSKLSEDLIKKYPQYEAETSSGQYYYVSLFMDRIQNSSLAKVIIFIILSFFVFEILRYFSNKIKKYVVRNQIKKGIDHFKDNTSENHFEDLIKSDEILDIESMCRIMRGTETNVKRLDAMNEERIKRLKRIWRRRNRRNTLKRNTDSLETSFSINGPVMFSTLSSYDFKVK